MATGRPDFWNLVSLVDRPYAPVGFPYLVQRASHSWNPLAAGQEATLTTLLGTGWVRWAGDNFLGVDGPQNARYWFVLDEVTWEGLISPRTVNNTGLTTPDIYNFASVAVRIMEWDTTNNRYRIRHWFTSLNLPFRDSFEAKVKNEGATDATVWASVDWLLLSASEELGCHLERMPTVEELEDLRDRLRAEGAVVEALVATNGNPPLLTVHVEAVSRHLPEALLHHTRHLAGGPRQVMGRRELRELRRRLAMEALRLETELLQQHGNARGAVQLQGPGAR